MRSVPAPSSVAGRARRCLDRVFPDPLARLPTTGGAPPTRGSGQARLAVAGVGRRTDQSPWPGFCEKNFSSLPVMPSKSLASAA